MKTYIIKTDKKQYFKGFSKDGVRFTYKFKKAYKFETNEDAASVLLGLMISGHEKARVISTNKEIINKNIEKYDKVCKVIIKGFCKKHDFDFEDVDFVANEFDGIICIADYYFAFRDIVTDMRLNAPERFMLEYYDKSLEAYEKGEKMPNYENYVKYFSGFKNIKDIKK